MSTVVYTAHYKKDEMCPRCDEPMQELQACHHRCNNCGAEIDCSD